MNSVYNYPKYYEIAFSYRNIPQEVTVLEELIRQYSKTAVNKVLEIGCGNSPHMQRLTNRGYRYIGIDLNEAMLSYAQQKATNLDLAVRLEQKNMVDFRLDEPVDFAYTMLGSLYVESTSELSSHLGSVNKALTEGGLYFLDWCVESPWIAEGKDSWTIEQDDITVKVNYSTTPRNWIEQTQTERIELIVHDQDKVVNLTETAVRRVIFPQEFLILSELNGFEFIGWWNNWDVAAPLTGTEQTVNRPITLLRKK